MTYEERTQQAVNAIIDTMSGADGGVSFLKFKFFVENLATLADEGDETVIPPLEVLLRFQRLIEAAQKVIE